MRTSTFLLTVLCGAAASPGLAAAQDWSGPYVGVQVTSSSLKTDTTLDISGPVATNIAPATAYGEASQPGDLGDDGTTFGAHFGYLSQHGSWVIGGEIGLNSGLDSDVTFTGSPTPATSTSTYTATLSSDWNASLRLRGGWAGRNLMIYAIGGYDLRDVTLTERYRITSAAAPGTEGFLDFSSDDTVSGWTWGVGVELRPVDQWGLRLEYTHTDFGDLSDDAVVTGSFAGSPALTGTGVLDSDLEEEAVRLSVSWHF